ncbi:MAG: hypothetical protein OXC31_17515 [Spirochaetaceae bacterium]|nr:hypothetical protein [Spirochaetaceae bacterium]
MAETAMALGDSDLERIGAYVKGNLYGWVVEVAPHLVIGPQLLERTATIEQELKDQRELMAVRFDAMDRRFEETNERIAERFDAMDRRSDERFAAVDRRFEEMNERFAERFDAMDRRFDDMGKRADERFAEIGKRSDERFAEMGKRSDERFAAVNVRFEDMNKRFGSMQWLVGGAFVLIGVLMTVYEFIT